MNFFKITRRYQNKISRSENEFRNNRFMLNVFSITQSFMLETFFTSRQSRPVLI